VIYDWAFVMSCNCTFPDTKWYFCRLCKSQRKQLQRPDQLKRHNWLFHSVRKQKVADLQNDVVLQEETTDVDIGQLDDHCIVNSTDDNLIFPNPFTESIIVCKIQDIPLNCFMFMSECSKKFFSMRYSTIVVDLRI
jgi:hypothetical protein